MTDWLDRDEDYAYEVVWDGTHAGHDEDLLSAGLLRTPTKVPAPPLKPHLASDGVARCLRAHASADLPLALDEIAQLMGLPRGTVNSHLTLLKRDGRLRSRPLRLHYSRAPRVYWMGE